ncbi:MAG: 3-hydroxyacyl-ACP dehydratase FabZ [Elusimicrobiales bacterium]
MLQASDIIKIIPHRYPFLLIDRVEIIEEKRKAKGIKCISANELYFHGHFPDKPIMPGVLILESMAQVSATLMSGDPALEGRFAYFAGINRARFKKMVLPGSTIEVYVEVEKLKGRIAKINGIAKCDGDVVCEAELIFVIELE